MSVRKLIIGTCWKHKEYDLFFKIIDIEYEDIICISVWNQAIEKEAKEMSDFESYTQISEKEFRSKYEETKKYLDQAVNEK